MINFSVRVGKPDDSAISSSDACAESAAYFKAGGRVEGCEACARADAACDGAAKLHWEIGEVIRTAEACQVGAAVRLIVERYLQSHE